MDLPRNTQITTPNDADLLQDFVAQRCERAFATLVDRYQHLVMSVCLRQTHHRHDAEDAFPTTFQVLSANAVHLKNPASISSWLATPP